MVGLKGYRKESRSDFGGSNLRKDKLIYFSAAGIVHPVHDLRIPKACGGPPIGKTWGAWDLCLPNLALQGAPKHLCRIGKTKVSTLPDPRISLKRVQLTGSTVQKRRGCIKEGPTLFVQCQHTWPRIPCHLRSWLKQPRYVRSFHSRWCEHATESAGMLTSPFLVRLESVRISRRHSCLG